jgi:2'-5' RNA ligase
MSIRKHYKDEFRASLPIEITIAGSSGNGVIESGQDSSEVFSILDSIAKSTKDIKATFGKVLRFPNTNIFVFTLADEEPFRALHKQIAESGIRFKQSLFPYTPHCTLRSLSPVSEQEANELLGLRITDTFTLDTMSVLSLFRDSEKNLHVPLLHKNKLTG